MIYVIVLTLFLIFLIENRLQKWVNFIRFKYDKSYSWPKKNIKLGISGQCVGFTLEEEIFSQKGEIVSNLDTPPKLLNTFEANIFWLDNENVMIGRKYSIKITTGTYNIEFEKIVKVIDTKDLSKTKSNIIRKNDVAEVILKSNSLIPIDNFFDNGLQSFFLIQECQQYRCNDSLY